MGRLWCSTDPYVTINGGKIRIEMEVQAAHERKVFIAPKLLVIVPVDSEVAIEESEEPMLINGLRTLVETIESDRLTDVCDVVAIIEALSGYATANVRLSVWSPFDAPAPVIETGPALHTMIRVACQPVQG